MPTVDGGLLQRTKRLAMQAVELCIEEVLQEAPMQIILDQDPSLAYSSIDWHTPTWECSWIEDPTWDRRASHVCAFRNKFTLQKRTKIRFHITADQRYTVYMDGEKIGFGPERGTDTNWFYQTHDLTLPAGQHCLVARVWWLSAERGLTHLGLGHLGHVGHQPSLLVKGEGEMDAVLTSGKTKWQVMPLAGIAFTRPVRTCVGGRTNIDAAKWPRKVEQGSGPACRWQPACTGDAGLLAEHIKNDFPVKHLLRHSRLPPMVEKTIHPGKVRHAQSVTDLGPLDNLPFITANHNPKLAINFQHMIDGKSPVVIPARSRARLLIDVNNYVCAWPTLTVSKGKNSHVGISWSEALYETIESTRKGNRNIIEGKYFVGLSDTLHCDGSQKFVFEPLWWEAGRYICLYIETAQEELKLDAFTLRETHYPIRFESTFTCDDPRWKPLIRIAKRTMEMCSHEVYFDCPYYEQLMYAGDTRLELLTTYATSRDDRLPRKALTLFDASRDASGLTRARTPAAREQTIPPFCLWWAMMVHDYAFWRNDKAFVKRRMPGVRAVLEAFRSGIGDDGLLYALAGWNFTDWVKTWPGGRPADAQSGANATLNLQLVWVLRAIAELEDYFGESELAMRNRRTADRIAEAVRQHFWVPERQLFADNKDKDQFSEHAQCMAVLGGSVPKDADLTTALLNAKDLDRATIYFSHYLFETFRVLRRPEAIYERLGLWFEHESLGLKTTVEKPEPTRSDCHAWGAHPMFHAYASFAGIRPATPGFTEVTITPQLGPLQNLDTSMVHPSGGNIVVKVEKDKTGELHGTISVPKSVPAKLILSPSTLPQSWNGGIHIF